MARRVARPPWDLRFDKKVRGIEADPNDVGTDGFDESNELKRRDLFVSFQVEAATEVAQHGGKRGDKRGGRFELTRPRYV
jgi:hypothetical protein